MFFPFGRSRHTVLTGLLTLAATGAGIDALSKRLRLAPISAMLALAIFASMPDIHNPVFARWQKSHWESAMQQMDEAVPAGATLLANSETTEMLRLRLMPRDQRRVRTGNRQTVVYKGQFVTTVSPTEWEGTPTEAIRAAIRETRGQVWIIDAGLDGGGLRARRKELGVTTVIDEPGVLYLGRLP